MKKTLFTLLALLMLTGVGFTADKEITMEWQKTPLEADLAGFTVEVYLGQGTTLVQTYDIPYAGGTEIDFSVDTPITVPDGQSSEVCIQVKAYDTSGNPSLNWVGWVQHPEACTTIDLQGPGDVVNVKVTVKITTPP